MKLFDFTAVIISQPANWGRRRDKDNWGYTINDNPEIHAGRGFTSHEYLPWFNLYNMNGRLYDPLVGRFLSADNYVQKPDFSQNFNRYSYCLNNPLLYVDYTGNTWLNKFKKWAKKHNLRDLIGPHNPISWIASGIEAINNGDWSYLDPTNPGTIINNSSRLFQGLFAADTDKKGWGWQIVSRFTWQAYTTLPGYALANTLNVAGKVEKVEIFRGATVVPIYGFGDDRALSFGGFMLLDSNEEISLNNPLFIHEYGHFLQNRQWGPFSLPMSLQSLGSTMGLASTRHQETFWERDANARSFNYFQNDMTPGELATYRASNYWNRRKLYDNRIGQYGIPLFNVFYFFYNIHNSN